jgi:glycosyltransferase involved in cell wall biosynthesis
MVLGQFGSGGVERVACLLANGFAAHGWSSHMLVVKPDGPTRSLVNEGVTVTPLLRRPRGKRSHQLLLSVIPIARYLRKARPAIVFAPGNHTHIATALAHWLAGGKQTALVIKITNPIKKVRYGPVRMRLRHIFYRWMLRRAGQVIVLSPAGIAEVHAVAGTSDIDVRFVHNPYIASSAITMDRIFDDGTPMILAVGRLTPQKNFGLLLDALALLRTNHWRLVLLGEGPEEAWLKAKARELGIADRVTFVGFVQDTAHYYASAHMLVISSRWEDLPATALEAMGAGCRVVSTECSAALCEIVRHAQSGVIVPIDAMALAHAIADSLHLPWERSVSPAIAAYSISNGVAEHINALAAMLSRRLPDKTPKRRASRIAEVWLSRTQQKGKR